MQNKGLKYSEDEIKQKIKEIRIWHFPFMFGDIIVPAEEPQEYLDWKSSIIPNDLSGKTVLEVGSHEGYFSMIAEQRGAKRVVSTDDKKMLPPDIDKRISIVHDIMDSKNEYLTLSVYDLDKIDEIFDVVIYFDVYYHLEDPLLAFKKIFTKVKDVLLFCGYIIDERFIKSEQNKPLMYMFEPFELNPDDSTNVWGATTSCLVRMMKHVGFRTVNVISTWPQQSPSRVLIKAYK